MDVDALDVDLRVPDDREVRRRRDGTRRNATRQLETNLNSKLKIKKKLRFVPNLFVIFYLINLHVD